MYSSINYDLFHDEMHLVVNKESVRACFSLMRVVLTWRMKLLRRILRSL